jgi:hypothetical protein
MPVWKMHRELITRVPVTVEERAPARYSVVPLLPARLQLLREFLVIIASFILRS